MNYIASAIDEHIRKGDVLVSFSAVGGVAYGIMDGFNFPNLFDNTILSIGMGDALSFLIKLISVAAFGGVSALGGVIVKEVYPIVREMVKRKYKSIKNHKNDSDIQTDRQD